MIVFVPDGSRWKYFAVPGGSRLSRIAELSPSGFGISCGVYSEVPCWSNGVVRRDFSRHGPQDVMERLAAGEEVDPREYYFRATPTFETGASGYAWLNGIIAVATGERRADQVLITVYEVT